MKQLKLMLIILFASTGFWHGITAQGNDASENREQLNAEIRSLKAGQEAIRKELKEIKELLANVKQPPPVRLSSIRDTDVILNVADDPYKGAPDALVTLIEFTDYQCPFCGRHQKSVMPQIQKNFIDTGKVRYVLRDFPLDFHRQAAKAHEAAHCASEQSRYWEMHEQLFAHQKALHTEKLPQYAEVAGVSDLAAFQECLDGGRYAERARKSVSEGVKAGVRGVPSFVIGVSEQDGTTVKGKKFIHGSRGYSVFDKVISELLASIER